MSHFSRRQLLQSAAASTMGAALWNFGSLASYGDQPTAKQKKDAVKTGKNGEALEPYIDAKFLDGPSPLPGKDKFTLVVLPDTQHYSLEHPKNYHAQTEWIDENAKDRNIVS